MWTFPAYQVAGDFTMWKKDESLGIRVYTASPHLSTLFSSLPPHLLFALLWPGTLFSCNVWDSTTDSTACSTLCSTTFVQHIGLDGVSKGNVAWTQNVIMTQMFKHTYSPSRPQGYQLMILASLGDVEVFKCLAQEQRQIALAWLGTRSF